MKRKMESHNLSDFATLYFGSMFPLHFNSNLDYDTFQKLNSTVHTLFNNGELYDVLFRNNRSAPDRDELYIVIPITVLYILIFLAGIVGNVSTCTVIVRNKSMHTATNYYLFSLAVSDLLLLLSGLPTDVYRMWYPDVYIFGDAACRLLSLSSETSANATVLTITAFTIERYIAICHPFLSHTMSKLSRVVKFIIAIWVVALCLAVPQVIQFGVVYSRENGRTVSSCTVKETIMEHAFEISGFVFFVGPMTAITVLYVLIGIKLKRSRLLRPPKTPSQNSQQEQNGNAKSYKNGVSQSRAIKMLVAVAVSFFICWAPFHAQRLLAVYGKNSDEPSRLFMQVYQVLTYLSGVLYFLSTTINPFLYSIMSNKFREAFKSTIAHRCCGNKKKRSFNVSKGVYRNKNGRLRNSGTRLTILNVLPKSQRGEGNNNMKLADRAATISMIQNDLHEPKESGLFNSISDRLYKSTRGVFKPKIDDINTIPNSKHSSRRIQCESTESGRSHSISNSSLQDMEGEEFTGKELVSFMEQVNNNICQ